MPKYYPSKFPQIVVVRAPRNRYTSKGSAASSVDSLGIISVPRKVGTSEKPGGKVVATTPTKSRQENGRPTKHVAGKSLKNLPPAVFDFLFSCSRLSLSSVTENAATWKFQTAPYARTPF